MLTLLRLTRAQNMEVILKKQSNILFEFQSLAIINDKGSRTHPNQLKQADRLQTDKSLEFVSV